MSTETTDQNVRHRASAFTRVVYTVFWLNLLVLTFFLTGLLAGWFWPEAGVTGNRYRVSLVVNTAEAKKDLEEVADATQNIADVGSAVADLRTVQGQIRKVDWGTQTVQLVNEEEEYQVKLTEATEYDLNGEAAPEALQQGDSVRVTMRKKDDQYFATQIIADNE